jgi:SAM-dependent methyltransferase
MHMTTSEAREYLWEGRGGPFTLLLTEGAFAPTHTSREVAEGLTINPGDVVIDVGCGTGVLSFVAAKLGASRVYGTDVNPHNTAIARVNADRLGLGDVVEIREGNLFEPLGDLAADVVIGDVSGIPDEMARVSDWFPGGYSGGPTGAEVPVAMLEASRAHLRPGGRLYLPTGTIQDEVTVLDAARRVFQDGVRQMRERLLPLPTKIGESAVVRKLMDSGVVQVIRRGSRVLWQLRVWECTVPGSPPPILPA